MDVDKLKEEKKLLEQQLNNTIRMFMKSNKIIIYNIEYYKQIQNSIKVILDI